MGFSSLDVAVTLVALILLSLNRESGAATYLNYYCSNSTPAFSPNSIYQSNLYELLSSLSSNVRREDGFYNTTVGQSTSDVVYGLFLCRGDGTVLDCQECVSTATQDVKRYCPIERTAVIWYEECKNETFSVRIIVPIVAAAVLLLAVVSFYMLRRQIRKAVEFQRLRRQRKPVQDPNARNDVSTLEKLVESLQFDLPTIEAATTNFSENNKLGTGGFGVVYKGVLFNGQEIAVKRLSGNSKDRVEEFKNEVCLTAKLQHRNLVRLLGFCLEGEEKMLIYEFVSNRSLDHFLYGIGLKNCFYSDETNPHLRKFLKPIGYMAPEYAIYGQFSVKSDIYSFGVLVLEILSGKNNTLCFQQKNNVEDLRIYAWKHWTDGTPLAVLDPSLIEYSYSSEEVIRCIHIGLLCIQENPDDRPTMASVVLMMNSYSIILPSPQQPSFNVLPRRIEPNNIMMPTKQQESEQFSSCNSLAGSVKEGNIIEPDPR
ncbi:Cysteine-rich receptor-like protein kinase 10 [Morella rubra]|uniref:Cysteine-rich receptor-like protein kinase 10 n=1 Tax=Morella rubra TaxID=262757 RepID=A0A6A1WAF3_9ROSI|nr:Cysteine-rich receptor-like protein kinase 10 [Morella rubra]